MTRVKIGLLFFIINQCYVSAQDREQLKAIIALDMPIAEKQERVDSLVRSIDSNKTPELADFYHDLGYQWYYKKIWRATEEETYLDSAIGCFQHAIHLKKSLSEVSKTSLARSLYNKGYCHSKKAQYFDAIAAYEEIIDLNQRDQRMANAYHELGKIKRQVGDYYRSLDNFREMAKLGLSIGSDDCVTLAYIECASTYAAINRFENQDSIRANLERSQILLEEGNEKWYMLKNTEANFFQVLGEYEMSLNIFHQLLNTTSIENEDYLALLNNNLGHLYLEMDNLQLAKEHLNKSLSYNDCFSFTYENLAEVYLAEGQFSKVPAFYDKAIAFAKHSAKNRVNFSTSSSAYYHMLEHTVSKALGFMTMHQHSDKATYLQEAFDTFYQADSLVDVIRFRSAEYRSKLFWRQQSSDIYLNAVRACFLLDRPADAYYFMEKNKALLLLEELSNEQAKSLAKLPTELAAKELLLKQQIYQLSSSPKSDSNTAFNKNIYEAKKSYEKFIDSLVQVYPTYGKLKQKVTILPYGEFIKKYTTEKQSVIHYIVNDTIGYGLLSTPKGSTLYEIGENYRQLTDTVIYFQQRPIQTTTDAATYAALSHQLLWTLISPELLPKQASKLLILADGVLHQLSFEGLCTDSTSFDHFFIEEQIVRRSQSISLLEARQQRKRVASDEMMAFAPVQFTDLHPLHETINEATTISQLFEGALFIKAEATKHRFQEAANQYGIIHLATHAGFHSDGEPWIAFYDDKLTLTETYAVSNSAELVVLGACKTSLGEFQAGEGLMSMERGFFYSGTKSVVSTLWSANDASTSEILINFYKYLSTGKTKSNALRKAKMDYLQSAEGSAKSPYYWASLTIMGADEPIRKSAIAWWMIVTPLLLITILFIVARTRKVSQTQ